LWAADARGGVTRIGADGTQQFIGQRADQRFASATADDAGAFEAKFTQGTLPNGLAFAANGDILISNFGTDRLEVMTRDGATRTLHDSIDGLPIGKVNFVLRDSRDRIWITVSTRVNPWTTAASSRVRDGYIAVVDADGLRVVADGFYFTNEVRLDAREEWLYIVETTGPRITRMRLDESGAAVRLADREVFGPAHLGGYPDGITFDAHGNLWCTLVMTDQLIALTPQGDKRVLLDDGDPEASANLLRRMDEGTVRPEDMQRAHGTVAPWMASMRTARALQLPHLHLQPEGAHGTGREAAGVGRPPHRVRRRRPPQARLPEAEPERRRAHAGARRWRGGRLVGDQRIPGGRVPERPLRPANKIELAHMRAWRQFIDEVPTPSIRYPSFNAYFVRCSASPATRSSAPMPRSCRCGATST
jgi:gluconolactonase